jgi:two-component system sensor histidine kinase/response regulator
MTANVMSGDIEQCREAGMNDHVAKPIDPQLLFGALLKWIPPRAHDGAPGEPVRADSREATPTGLGLSIVGLDEKAGLRRTLNKHAAYERLLRDFVTRYAGAADTVRSELAAGKRDDAQRTAHTLKGVAGTIGAGELQARAAALEQALRSGASEVELLLKSVEEELVRLTAALKRALRPEAPAASAAECDWNEALPVLERLEALLGSDDAQALDVYDEHAALLRAAGGEDAGALERHVRGYRFVDALAVVRRVRSRVPQQAQG